MITPICFNKCMNTLLTFASVSVDENKNRAWYQLMKNDFTDSEFSRICNDICKTESLYGRYPDPKLFYSRYDEYKDPVVNDKTDIKLLEKQRNEDAEDRKKRAEEMQRWIDFIKSKGFCSTVDVIMSGKEVYDNLRNEFRKKEEEN